MRHAMPLVVVVSMTLALPASAQDKNRLPKPLDHIPWDDTDFLRFFTIEGSPRFAKKGEFPKAGENDTLVWTVKAKKDLPDGLLGSIIGRRFARFYKDTNDRHEPVARLHLRVDGRYLIGRESLEKGKTVAIWVHLGEHLEEIRKHAMGMDIYIEGR